MDIPPSVLRPIEDYLAAVGKRLAHEPEAVRREILDDLREHVMEALRRSGGEVSSESAARVLAQMDATGHAADVRLPWLAWKLGCRRLRTTLTPSPRPQRRARNSALCHLKARFIYRHGTCLQRSPEHSGCEQTRPVIHVCQDVMNSAARMPSRCLAARK